jgi:hypothetical protein
MTEHEKAKEVWSSAIALLERGLDAVPRCLNIACSWMVSEAPEAENRYGPLRTKILRQRGFRPLWTGRSVIACSGNLDSPH